VFTVLLALGANRRGTWGDPRQTLARALRELPTVGVEIRGTSAIYRTDPLGRVPQERYLNAVINVEFHGPPLVLLRRLKGLERRAGRRMGPRWGPRALDIDILDFRGLRRGWPRGRQRATLMLPHPELERRAFVLLPLLEVAPAWRHPALGVPARWLALRLPKRARAGVQRLDFMAGACDMNEARGQPSAADRHGFGVRVPVSRRQGNPGKAGYA
jgi:2-amino-4-hydroxy-6-hydroxymethyldihydropteridine diphosphokinase